MALLAFRLSYHERLALPMGLSPHEGFAALRACQQVGALLRCERSEIAREVERHAEKAGIAGRQRSSDVFGKCKSQRLPGQ